MTEAVKFDTEKERHDLIPPETLNGIARVLTFGARKYGDRNWEKGFKYGRIYAAAQRHLLSWWGGENIDPETGESHLSHTLCCLMFLSSFEINKTGEDDRPLRKHTPSSKG